MFGVVCLIECKVWIGCVIGLLVLVVEGMFV